MIRTPLVKKRDILAPLRAASAFACAALIATAVSAQQVDLGALDAYFAGAQHDWPVPGLSVAIVKNGMVVLEKGYGVRDIRGDSAVDEHTLYAIASNSKAFTAAALAQQVDAEKLSWEDRVIDYLPWFRLYDDYVTQEIRIRDLLSHRSGLGTYSGDLLWYGTSYSAEEVVRRARYLPAAFPFRDGYGYSNIMFIAAGEVLRNVAGEDWHDYVERALFVPLGMTRSVTSTRDLAALDNVATPHKNERGEVLPLQWYNWDAAGAAGGIISSVHDMAQWRVAQLGGGVKGDVRLFSEDRQLEMWIVLTPRVVSSSYQRRYPTTHYRGYGMGWNLADYRGRKVMSHGGGYDGMFSQVALVPEEGLGVVILTNSMTDIASALVYRVLDVYLGGEPRDWSTEGLVRWRESRATFEARQESVVNSRVPGTRPSLALERYAGTYGGPMYGDGSVALESGHLVLRLLPNADLVADLEHLHYDTFIIRWRKQLAWFGVGTANFVLDAAGNVEELRLDVPNEDFWFNELEMKRKE